MITVETMHLVQFRTFMDAKIDLRKYRGIVSVEGQINGAYAKSNGSGKTTYLEGLYWGLYGKLLKKQNSERIINDMCKSCSVEIVIFKQETQERVTIFRHRNRSGKVTITLKGISHNADTSTGIQNILTEWLGMDSDTFLTTVMFSGIVSKFCELSDIERRKVLEKLLSFELYTSALEESRKNVNMIKKRGKDFTSEISKLKEEREHLEVDLQHCIKQSEKFVLNQRKRIHKHVLKANSTVDAHTETINNLCDERTKYAELSYAAKSDKKSYLKVIKKLKKSYKSAHAVQAESTAELNVHIKKLKEAKRHLRDVESGNIPEKCPTCDRAYKDHGTHQVINIVPYKAVVTELAYMLAEHKERNNAVIKKTSADIRLYEQSVRDLSEFDIDSNKLRQLDSHVDTLEARIADIFETLDGVKAERDTSGTYSNRIKEKQKNLDLKVALVHDDISKLDIDLKVAQFLSECAFSRTNGIPALLIQEAIPTISKYSRLYSGILSGNDFTVGMESPEDDPCSWYLAPYRGENPIEYESLSKGEALRADLSILFGIRQMISETVANTFSQTWLDEVFDGMDDSGIYNVAEMLRKVYKDGDVFIISHNAAMREYADNVMTFNKIDEVSTLVGDENGRKDVKSKRLKVRTSHGKSRPRLVV